MFGRKSLVLALIAAAVSACDRSPVGPLVDVVGDYALVSYNGAPIPAAVISQDSTGVGSAYLITRASISLRADGSYEATTCYDYRPADCSTSRRESGTYSVDANIVALFSGDGYSRALAAGKGLLTQHGGGDFAASSVLVYSK